MGKLEVKSIVGQLGVRIVPYTVGFRKDLQAQLKAMREVEWRGVKAVLDRVEVQINGAAVRERVSRQVGSVDARVGARVDEGQVFAAKRQLESQLKNARVSVTPSVNAINVQQWSRDVQAAVSRSAGRLADDANEQLRKRVDAQVKRFNELVDTVRSKPLKDEDVERVVSRLRSLTGEIRELTAEPVVEVEEAVDKAREAFASAKVTVFPTVDDVNIARWFKDVRRAIEDAAPRLEPDLDDSGLRDKLEGLTEQFEALAGIAREVEIPQESYRAALSGLKRLRGEIVELTRDPVVVEVEPELDEGAVDEVVASFRRLKLPVVPTVDDVNVQRWFADVRKAVEDAAPRLVPGVDDSGVRERLAVLTGEFERVAASAQVDVLSEEQFFAVLARLKDLRDEIQEVTRDRTVRVDFNPFTAWATARINVLTRPRLVEIVPRVVESAALRAEAALARLSGGRLVHDYVSRFADFLRDIDKVLPRVTAGLSGVTALTGGVLATVAGVAGLGDGLAALTPSLLLLPGLFANAALSVTVLAVAFKDAKRELAVLKSDFSELGDVISAGFWDRAREPIVSLFTSVMPQLRASFAEVSDAVGESVAVFASAFERQLSGGRLEAMFAGLAAFWREASRGADEFAGAVTNLGLVAARYMPRLGRWVADLSIRFDGWLSRVATDGRLDGWIEGAINNFKYLGRTVKAFGGIWAGVWDAAAAAGFRALDGVADRFEAWERQVRGAKWQATLTALFTGARRGMEAFGGSFRELGETVYVLRDDLRQALVSVSSSVAGLLSSVFKAFRQDEFRRGLHDLTQGVARGLDALKPAAGAFGRIIGDVGGTVGRLVERIAPVIGEAIRAAEPLIRSIMDTVEAFAGVLTPLLTGALSAAAAALRVFSPLVVGLGVALGAAGLAARVSAVMAALRGLSASGGLLSGVVAGFSNLIGGRGSGVRGASNALGGFSAAVTGLHPAGLAVAAAVGAVTAAVGLYKDGVDQARVSSAELQALFKSGADAWAVQAKRIRETFNWGDVIGQAWAHVGTGGLASLARGVAQQLNVSDLRLVTLVNQQFGQNNAAQWFADVALGTGKVREQFNNFGRELAPLVQSDLPGLQRQLQQVVRANGLYGDSQKQLLTSMPELKESLRAYAAEARVSATDQQLLDLALGRSSASFIVQRHEAVASAERLREFKSTLEGVNGVAAPVSDSLQRVSQELGTFGSRARNAGRANIEFEDALQRVRDSVAQYGFSLDITTEAGRRNAEALYAVGDATNRAAEAAILEGKGAADVAAIYDQKRESIRAMLEQQRIEPGLIQEIIDKYVQIPDHVDTYINSKTEGAEAGIRLVGDHLARLDGTTAVPKLNVDNGGALTAVEVFQRAWLEVRDRRVTASVETGEAMRNTGSLRDQIAGVKSKEVRLIASLPGFGALQTFAGIWAGLASKTITLFTRNVSGHAGGGTVGLPVPQFASGGTVSGVGGGVSNGTVFGRGTSKSDSVLVRLSRGEEVIQQPYASRFRRELKMLNQGRLPWQQQVVVAGGGLPDRVTLVVGGREFDAYVQEQAGGVVDDRLQPVEGYRLRDALGGV